ncbi:MAG TPA: LptF/LptG family permease [Planctomycetota bacterium]|jgi:lipopolysaccharide export LptBFGC system permease protein LptF|nr:LptF/LptG family permease [Planctomycetota bacterium]
MQQRGLKLGGRLDRYVGGLFVSSYATAFLLVIGLFLILDMATNLDDYVETWPGGGRAPAFLIVRYYLLDIPFLFFQVAPFVTLVAGLFTVSKLQRTHETIAALGAGVSAWRLLAPVFLLGAVCSVGMFALNEVAATRLAARRDALRFFLEKKRWDLVYQNLRLRDLNGSVVMLDEFRPAIPLPPEASDANVPAAPEVRGLQAILRSHTQWSGTEAARAAYVPRGDGMGWKLDGGIHEEVAGSQLHAPTEWLDGFDFTPGLAVTYWRARQNPLDLAFSEVRELARRDPDNVGFQTLLQYRLTFPLANVVLLLVGLPILMQHERRRGVSGMAAGIVLCVFYFAADFVLRNMGLQGTLDPLMAAWLPVLVFGSLGLVLYDSMQS